MSKHPESPRYADEFDVHRYFWGSLSARRCAYALALGDVAFADFGRDANGHLFLHRISFDGYGCCTPEPAEVESMLDSDSRQLVHLLETNAPLETEEVRSILRRYFEAHRNVIWEDALITWGLVAQHP